MKANGERLDHVLKWLLAWQGAIRLRDYDTAKKMFVEEVFAFGTVTTVAAGLDRLVAQQWQKQWPNNVAFTFEFVHAFVVDARGTWIVALPWSSRTTIPGQIRKGRATIVLRQFDTGLKCIHSHFSLSPDENQNSLRTDDHAIGIQAPQNPVPPQLRSDR